MARKALGGLAVAKTKGEGETPPPKDKAEAAIPTKVQTLRLPEPAWRQLRIIAAQRGVTMHSIMMDALNDVFRKEGVPPIA